MYKGILHQKLGQVTIQGFNIHSKAPKPAGNYAAVKRVGNTAYVSGQMPIKSSGDLFIGSTEDEHFGYESAKLAMANALIQLLSSEQIKEIASIIRVDGYFSTPHKNSLPQMLDGASDLIAELFEGNQAHHARTVFGVDHLPYEACVELAIIAEVK